MNDFAMFQDVLNNQRQEKDVYATFYDKQVKTDAIGENGLPVFKTVTYVKIEIKDNRDVFDQPMQKEHMMRFPVEYNRYLISKKERESGTPLNQFAFLNAAQLNECEHYGVFTVEKLADLTDEQAGHIGLIGERNAAKRFLEVAKNNAAIADFNKKEEEYKAQIKELKAQIRELQAAKKEAKEE